MNRLVIAVALCFFCIGCNNKVNKSDTQKENTVKVEVANTTPTVSEPTTEEPKVVEEQPRAPKKNSIAGTYVSDRLGDVIELNEDGTGTFTFNSAGGGKNDFTWKRSGKNVIIKIEGFSNSIMKYDSKEKSITEHSKDLGNIVYYKDE